MAVDLSVPLEQLIAAKLGSLSLRDDEETVEFVRGLVEEDSFEPEVRSAQSSSLSSPLISIPAGPEERYPRHA